MSVVAGGGRLRYEMARRGWDGSALARAARISAATVSTALAGRPISAKSLSLIASALAGAPAVESIDVLLSDRNDGRDLG